MLLYTVENNWHLVFSCSSEVDSHSAATAAGAAAATRVGKSSSIKTIKLN